MHGMSHSPTLLCRNKGNKVCPTYNHKHQKLGPIKEQVLVDYIEQKTQAGYTLSIEMLQQMANVLLSH